MTSRKMAHITRTEVCISVDVEFDIAGTFADPVRHTPVAESNVWCRENERSHGLGFLLATLGEHGLRATFFVEALNNIYFGDAPMQTIARTIVDAGHDVQLHLHPVWEYFHRADWRERLAHTPPNDSVVGRGPDEIGRLIREGKESFKRWGIAAPVALRTGGLHVDLDVYSAMQAQGIGLASNVGVGIFRPGSEQLRLYSGCHRVNGVIEVPVLTYRRRGLPSRFGEKSLTVTGSSWREIKQLLLASHRKRVGPIVLLTHPHEFARPNGRGGWRANELNQYRFRRLCEFLTQRRDEFDIVTFGERAPAWGECANVPNTTLSVSGYDGIRGLVENAYNDWVLALSSVAILFAAGAAVRHASVGILGA